MEDPSAYYVFGDQNVVARKDSSMTRLDLFGKAKTKMRKRLIGDPKRPYNNVRDYLHSLNVTKSAIQEYPNLHLQDSVDHEHAQWHVTLYRTEQRLAACRKKLAARKRVINQEWAELEQKEHQLHDNFIAFDKFVKENHEKRQRARKKIEDENELLRARQAEIVGLQADLDEMKRIKGIMDMNIHSYAIFQKFIEQVTNASDEFKNTNDVLNRYVSLSVERNLMASNQKHFMSVLENAKFSMMKLIEEKNFVIMGLNNQIANLQARYENANIKALECEGLVTDIKNNAVKQMGEIDTVKTSIWNVYVHMATSKKHPIKIRRDDVEEQMMYINRTLTELNKVNKLIKKRSNKLR